MTSPARVRVYSTEWCPYCRKAVALLKQKGATFEEIDCSGDDDVRAWLVEATGRRTVPQIFIADVPVGGCDDLYALDKRGELEALLAGTRTPSSVAPGRTPGPPPR